MRDEVKQRNQNFCVGMAGSREAVVALAKANRAFERYVGLRVIAALAWGLWHNEHRRLVEALIPREVSSARWVAGVPRLQFAEGDAVSAVRFSEIEKVKKMIGRALLKFR